MDQAGCGVGCFNQKTEIVGVGIAGGHQAVTLIDRPGYAHGGEKAGEIGKTVRVHPHRYREGVGKLERRTEVNSAVGS